LRQKKNAKRIFKLPVSWEVFSYVEVESDSLEEAFDWAKENIDIIPLSSEWDYVDGWTYVNTLDTKS